MPGQSRKPVPPTSARRGWLAPALLAVLTLAAYSNSVDLGVALDARGILNGDPRIRETSLQNLSLILRTDYWWPSSVDRLYRPITTASFLFNYAILGNGQNPAGYHWLNLLLHLVNVWLVYRLARRLLRSEWPAFFAAAIWAVHPISTEVVANIAGRADLLAAMAVLAGLLLFVRLRAGEIRRPWIGYTGLFAVSAMGVFAKENAAVLVGLMLLWDVAFPTGVLSDWRRRGVAYLAPLAALAVMLAARTAVFAAAPWPEMPFVDNPIRAASFLAGRMTAIRVIGLDLWLLVWPAHLSSDRAFNAIPTATFADWRFWASFAVVIGILAAVFLRRRDRLMFWAAGFFGIALLPTSNLLFPIGSIMAERFLYMPAIGFAVAVTALAWRMPNRQWAAVLLCILVAAFAMRTWARNPDWRNDAALNAADVPSAPGSFRLHEDLANSLYQQDARGNLDQAIREGEIAWNILRVLPPRQIYQQTPAHLGLYYLAEGDRAGGATSPEGRAWYAKSLAVLQAARAASQANERAYDEGQLEHGKPLTTRVAYQPLYFFLAAAEDRLGQYAEAVESARYGLDLDPTRADGYDALAVAYRAMEDADRARITLDEKAAVLGLSPALVAELRQAYGPESCALAVAGDAVRLNLNCPRLKEDLCAAWPDLARVFTSARIPKPAEYFAQTSAQNGCAAVR